MKKQEEFISEQLEMLKNEFSKSQIRDNVYRYVFDNGIPNASINALIDVCMELYSKIIVTSINQA